MRTITLELLRHGPPNNQLLSPLTPYLALCENHAAVTVNVPFEHNQFLHRLSALSYKHGAEPRNFYINDTAKVLGDLLSSIPGLTAELSRSDDDPEKLTHLRLIVSSSELALLPFELALSPNGFPGTGQHILLQSQVPICITREVRRVPELHITEPIVPKILIAAASPPGFEEVPLQSHLLALRSAIDPWLPQNGTINHLDDHLVVLPQASDHEIETECAKHQFTHVHILAHGVEYKEGYDVRFGLALHDPRNPDGQASIIDGARLATALRPTSEQDNKNLARPSVVSLASCNSGNQGSVAGAGASVAHALHESGIPIVVASQFPLSFEGSVRMIEILYDGLLWGEDPRALLCELRRKLYSQFPHNHDWASLTAYASLSPSLEYDLNALKLQQARRSIEVAISVADEFTSAFYTQISSNTRKTKKRETRPDIEDTQKRIEFAKKKMSSLLSGSGKSLAMVLGYLASTEKRQAEIVQNDESKSKKLLIQARDYYWRAFQADRSNSWGVVQYLSLSVVLSRWQNNENVKRKQYEKAEADLWTLAHATSRQDVHSADLETKTWAIGNLIELYLLAPILDDWPGKPDQVSSEDEALNYARQLVELVGEDDFAVYSTQRQMARYEEWYSRWANLDPVQDQATNLIHALPSTWGSQDGKSIVY